MRTLPISALLAFALSGCGAAPKPAPVVKTPPPAPRQLIPVPVTRDSATITIEPVRPDLAAAMTKSPLENGLPVFGEKTEATIRVTVSGAVVNRGIYHLKTGASFADAVAAAGGFSRLSTSRFSIMREGKFIRIFVGTGGHYFSPQTADILPLWILRESDQVYVAETDPY